MSAGDGVLASALSVLVPLKCDLSSEIRRLMRATNYMKHTLEPAGMDTVETPVPVRPLTLQVRSFEVTSVTGLLLGGIRMSVF